MEEGNWIYIKRRRRRVRWTERKRQRRRGWQELGASRKGTFFSVNREWEGESKESVSQKQASQSSFPLVLSFFSDSKKKGKKRREKVKWTLLHFPRSNFLTLWTWELPEWVSSLLPSGQCCLIQRKACLSLHCTLVSLLLYISPLLLLLVLDFLLKSHLAWRLRLLSFPFSASNTKPGGCCCDAEK